jgi:hypothetical protein
MLAEALKKICRQRGKQVDLTPFGPFVLVDNGTGAFIQSWDENQLGPRPTQAEIEAVDNQALADEIASEHRAAADIQEFLRKAKSKWEAEFIPLRNWARTKGYPG